MAKTRINFEVNGTKMVGMYDKSTHTIKGSDGKIYKPKNVKVNEIFD